MSTIQSNPGEDCRGGLVSSSRRGFLQGVGAAAGLYVAPAILKGLRADTEDNVALFTLGVASGDPGAHSIVLWTRLAPDPLAGGGMPGRPVPV